jgi:hypothetical protein
VDLLPRQDYQLTASAAFSQSRFKALGKASGLGHAGRRLAFSHPFFDLIRRSAWTATVAAVMIVVMMI